MVRSLGPPVRLDSCFICSVTSFMAISWIVSLVSGSIEFIEFSSLMFKQCFNGIYVELYELDFVILQITRLDQH